MFSQFRLDLGFKFYVDSAKYCEMDFFWGALPLRSQLQAEAT